MCKFCDWLHSIVDDDNTGVLDPVAREQPGHKYRYIVNYCKRIGTDNERPFCPGDIYLDNGALMLTGDDYEPVTVELNYCPECSESLEWAKNKLLTKAQKMVRPEILDEKCILNQTTNLFLNRAKAAKIDCQPVDYFTDVNRFVYKDYTVDIDMIGMIKVHKGNTLVFSGYNFDYAVKEMV